MIRLYDYVLSASCYKVRLMAALMEVPLELEAVDFHPGRQHRGVAFRRLNPAGTLPVLVDGDLVLTESTAMLAYLASLGNPDWLGPDSPRGVAEVQQWLAFSGRLAGSLGMARLHDMLLYPGDIDAFRREGHAALRELEAALAVRRLARPSRTPTPPPGTLPPETLPPGTLPTAMPLMGAAWLVGDAPSIADIACFPNVMLAPDGGISLDAYPAIRLWTRAIRALDRFIEMPGIHRLHELKPAPVPV